MACVKQRTCVVPSCKVVDRNREIDLSWHLFPNSAMHQKMRINWITIIRNLRNDEAWEPTREFRICSRHFLTEELYTAGIRRRLRGQPVPTLFLHDATMTDVNSTGMQLDVPQVPEEPMEVTPSTAKSIGTISCPSCANTFSVTEIDGKLQGHCATDQLQPGEPNLPPSKSRKRLFHDPEDVDHPSSDVSFQVSSPLFITVTPKSRRAVRNEHSYCASPGQAADELKAVKKQLADLRVKYHQLELKLERRDRAQSTHMDSLESLKALSNRQVDTLDARFPELLFHIVENEKRAFSIKGKSGMEYDEEIKKFSATLHYHSPKAYRFLRHYLTLPHPSTIASWMKSSDCGPGYNLDVISRLGEARLSDTNNVMTDVVMIIDEMAIRRALVWDSSKHCYVGFVDYGTSDIDEPENPQLASNVLVCMIAGISGGWKCPIGYIYTDKVNGETQRAFLHKAFVLLEEQQFNVWALISDGCTSNVSLFEGYGVSDSIIQGASFEIDGDFPCSFPNPANPSKSVYAMTVYGMKYVGIREYKRSGKRAVYEKRLIDSDSRRAALGMMISIKSVIAISKALLIREFNPFKFVLTYRFCQDPFELFFNTVRGRLGNNNNPTVVEFRNIMKSIWHQNLLKSTNTGNCIAQIDEGEVPGGMLPLKRVRKLKVLDMDDIDALDIIDLSALSDPHYSDFYRNCLAYISGNVVRVVGTKLKCEICAESLLNTDDDLLPSHFAKLIEAKDSGGLFTPCHSVFRIVELTDACYRQICKTSGGLMKVTMPLHPGDLEIAEAIFRLFDHKLIDYVVLTEREERVALQAIPLHLREMARVWCDASICHSKRFNATSAFKSLCTNCT
ncbi:DNA transposase THAP9 [Folsomia candida]|uniref:DNA transposase THAP9 n=1 Tax=Folsomia candida TaxID=158441 RepID=A0A226DSV7_FOLCA|nr:DNA transposase THAP9 [Folsomia candida]